MTRTRRQGFVLAVCVAVASATIISQGPPSPGGGPPSPGTDVNYTWGLNTHGQRMGGPMRPEMMRWLWRDHPVSTDVNDIVGRSFNAPGRR